MMKKLLLLSITSSVSFFAGLRAADGFGPASSASKSASGRAPSRLFVSTEVDLAGRVDFREGAARDLSTLEQWAAACGAQRAEGLQLYEEADASGNGSGSSGSNVGVMTTQTLAANTPVLTNSRLVLLALALALALDAEPPSCPWD